MRSLRCGVWQLRSVRAEYRTGPAGGAAASGLDGVSFPVDRAEITAANVERGVAAVQDHQSLDLVAGIA